MPSTMSWALPPVEGCVGGAGVIRVDVLENVLLSPIELMAATDTVYRALSVKPFKISVVLEVYTVLRSPELLVSW